VCEFELNYEVHKRRSANFFFITFDVSSGDCWRCV
jgi:hypothetical protein